MSQSGRAAHAKALPNYERAVIPRMKLERYVLDTTHPIGKHKAIVFKSALGFEQVDWEKLHDSIVSELPFYEAFETKTDQHGTRYNVTMQITGPNNRTVDILTAWVIRRGTDYPSFVTALVK
jgi:hypothetical protein